MSTLAVTEPRGMHTLKSLTELANREHALAMQAARGMLQHAIASGEAMLDLKRHVPEGSWKAWIVEHVDMSWSTANDYMRVAYFKDRLDELDVTQLEEALTVLRGYRRNPNTPGRHGLPDLREEALRLHRRGVSQSGICDRLGVAKSTVYWWTHPKKQKAHLKALSARNSEAKQLREQNQARKIARAVRKDGAALAELYAMAERMQDVLAQAEREAESRDTRRHLALAGQHYRRMRDEVVKALGAHA